jgi:organic radical activating enzyme
VLGDNPKRPALNHQGTELYVKNIFKTLQGEGILVGTPAIFLRLGGCNLACSFCDTEFEDFYKLSVVEIVKKIEKLSYNLNNIKTIELVVITGGEPLRQNIDLCCKMLITSGFKVQVETNGTLYRALPEEVNIVCSPKVNRKGVYSKLSTSLLARISALKFLISDSIEGYNSVPDLGQKEYRIPVFLQPLDQNSPKLNSDNAKLAIKLSLEYGYRTSIQIHKILAID